jgi:hypothetical protein
MRFAKTLQRVIFLSLLVAFVSGAFWPFEKKKKGRGAAAAEIEDPVEEVAQPGVSRKTKEKAAKKTQTVKANDIRKKFSSVSPNMLTSSDIKDAINSNAFQDTFGGEDAENITD